jgi:hypothetical protein
MRPLKALHSITLSCVVRNSASLSAASKDNKHTPYLLPPFYYIPGRRLKNNLLRTVTTLSVVECSLECLRESCCQSVNFGKDFNNMMEHDCELNEAKASTSPGDITRNDSYIHYEIMDTGNGVGAETCGKGKIFEVLFLKLVHRGTSGT